MLLGSQSPHLGGPGTSFLEEVRCWHPATCLKADRTPWITSRLAPVRLCRHGSKPKSAAMSLSIRSCWSLFKTIYFNVRHNRWALSYCRSILVSSGLQPASLIGVQPRSLDLCPLTRAEPADPLGLMRTQWSHHAELEADADAEAGTRLRHGSRADALAPTRPLEPLLAPRGEGVSRPRKGPHMAACTRAVAPTERILEKAMKGRAISESLHEPLESERSGP